MNYILSIDVGIKNLSYCFVETGNDLNNSKIIKWKNVSIIDKKCNTAQLNELTRCMLDCLKTEFDIDFLKNITHVIIENQPGLINRTMKSLSIVIYTFFMMNDVNVNFIAAINKLKCSKCQELLKQKDYNLKKYQDRKKLSIDTTIYYVKNEFKEWDEFYSKSKKKDDLADCFLYIMYFVEKGNLR
jgi:hypothetical protein